MSTQVPPFNARFSYINETWETIGWATQALDGGYVWCHLTDAEFVIGQKATEGHWHIIAPIANIGRASRTRDWKYSLPDYLRIQEHQRATENVGRFIRVLSGELVFD